MHPAVEQLIPPTRDAIVLADFATGEPNTMTRFTWTPATLAVLLSVSVLSSLAHGQLESNYWRPYIELEARGTDPWAGQGNLFVPLFQSEVSMAFADVRGNWTDLQAAHGNFELGFRQMLVFDWIFGIHGGYDIRHSELGNSFGQGVLGLEMLNPDWGFRWNGYLAQDEARSLAASNTVSLIGNQLFIQQAEERAYSGVDFEVERRLWYREAPSDNTGYTWDTFHDMELWAALGVYNYDADAVGFGEITGPRARMELRIYDIPFGGPDSRLVLGGQIEDDSERGTVAQGMLTLRIPFGRGTSMPRSRLRGLNRRMVAPIERNTDIVSRQGFAAPERAGVVNNGQLLQNVQVVDGLTAALANEFATAPANTLFIADGAAGPLSGPITMQDNQLVMGGGSSVVVTGVNSGATATFTAPGTRPTFDSTINAANGSSLLGLNIQSGDNTISGINIDGVNAVNVQDVTINLTGNDSTGIRINNGEFAISSTTIQTSGSNSDGVVVTGTSRGQLANSNIGTSNDDSEGVVIGDSSFLALQNTRIFTSGTTGAEGVLATGSSQLAVSGGVITVTGTATRGLVATPGAGDQLNLRVASTTVNATAEGIVLGGGGFNAGTLDASVTGSTIMSPIGQNEIAVTTSGTARANLSIRNNTLDPLTGTIRLDEIGGDIFVTESSPGTPTTGIDAVNGLPATNVSLPNGAVEFDALVPPVPPQ